MPGNTSTGFLKRDNAEKYVRNRDVKLKNGEVRKEENIQRVMCEGVCNKCREKLQWRFKYNKYKPLKNPSSCRDCNNKTIHKAYRCLCDACATKRKVCSSCSADILKANLEYTAFHKVVEEIEVGSATVVKGGVSAADLAVTMLPSSSSSSSSVAMDEENNAKKTKTNHSTDEPDDESRMEEDGGKTAGTQGAEEGEKVAPNLAGQWDERKFNTIANMKYSKDRVVGSTEDGTNGGFSFNK